MEYYKKYRKKERESLIAMIKDVIVQHDLKSKDSVLDMLAARLERITALRDAMEEECAVDFDYKGAAEHRAYRNTIEEFVWFF